jgi:hypothetical protein
MSMGWNHIILEGFCAKNWDYNGKSSKWIYGWEGNKNPEDRGKKPNPDYDPDIKKPEWPDFCKKHICYTCYEKDCPNLAIGRGRMKDVIWASKLKKKRKGKKK